MSDWSAESLSDRFLRDAERTEARYVECRAKVPRSQSYKRLHDEALAEFYVANRLHGRTFLASKERLSCELSNMLVEEFRNANAFDYEVFIETYRAEVRRLIAEFGAAG
jgi:hypothetical protein